MKYLRLYYVVGKDADGRRWESAARYKFREQATKELERWEETAAEGAEAHIRVETFALRQPAAVEPEHMLG